MLPDGERAKGLLKLANYARVAEVLGVSRASVAPWAKGQQVTPWQLRRLQELLGRNDESAPPEWARRMMQNVEVLAQRAGITEADLEAAAQKAVEQAFADGGTQLAPSAAGESPRRARRAQDRAARTTQRDR